MRLILTGARGRIGRVVGRHIREEGHDLFEIDRSDPDSPKLEAGMSLVGEFDGLIHLAANAWEGHHKIGPRYDEVQATTAVVELAERLRLKRLILASSMEMEPSLTGLGAVNKASYYKASKAYGEALFAAYAAQHQNSSVICLRLGGFYPDEPFEPHNWQNVLRLSEPMIAHWVSKSLLSNENFETWLAIGPGEFNGVHNK